MVAFFIQESIRTTRQIGRMLLGLSIDCIGTVNAFEQDIAALAKCKSVLSEGPRGITTDLQVLRCLPCGIVVSPPLEFPKELVNLLPPADARHVFLYYDSWARFSVLEERYKVLFQNILDRLAAATADEKKRREYEAVRDELFDQLTALVRDLYETLNDLGSHCCEILLMARTYGEFTETYSSIEEFTNGRWKSWQAIRDARAEFKKARMCADSPTATSAS